MNFFKKLTKQFVKPSVIERLSKLSSEKWQIDYLKKINPTEEELHRASIKCAECQLDFPTLMDILRMIRYIRNPELEKIDMENFYSQFKWPYGDPYRYC